MSVVIGENHDARSHLHTTCAAVRTASVSDRDLLGVAGLDTTVVKSLVERFAIHRTVRADGDDSRAWRAVAPLVLQENVYPLADDLQHGAAFGGVGAVDHAFAAVDVHRQAGGYFPERFERQRLVRFVAPCAEGSGPGFEQELTKVRERHQKQPLCCLL